MNYTVFWTFDALSALAAIWVLAPDRQAVTVAQGRIDQLLEADPLGNGVHVSEGLYAIEVRPLRAQYEVSEVNQIATVESVCWLP